MLRNACRTCAIRDKALCRSLPEDALAQLNQIARRRKVHAGQQIFDNAAEQPVVANLVSGVARLSRSLADGRTQIVGLQFPAEFIGRPFSSSGNVLVEAATDVELCYFSQRQFEALLLNFTDLKAQFLRRTIEQLDEAREWMLLLGRKTAEERVASLILLCLEKGTSVACDGLEAGDDRQLDLPLSRTDMASYLGLTIETVARMIKRVERAGAIKIGRGRRLSITNIAKLRELAERDRP